MAKDYFSKKDRGHHINVYILTESISLWLDETTALNPIEQKYIKSALTFLNKVNESILGRLGNKYLKTLKNDLIMKGKSIDETIKEQQAITPDNTIDDLCENLANTDVMALSEYVRFDRCKNCIEVDYLSCNAYHIFIRNRVNCSENPKGCPYQEVQ